MQAPIQRTALYRDWIARGDCSQAEILALIQDMRDMVGEGADPEELLHDEGFEPDYIFDILP